MDSTVQSIQLLETIDLKDHLMQAIRKVAAGLAQIKAAINSNANNDTNTISMICSCCLAQHQSYKEISKQSLRRSSESINRSISFRGQHRIFPQSPTTQAASLLQQRNHLDLTQFQQKTYNQNQFNQRINTNIELIDRQLNATDFNKGQGPLSKEGFAQSNIDVRTFYNNLHLQHQHTTSFPNKYALQPFGNDVSQIQEQFDVLHPVSEINFNVQRTARIQRRWNRSVHRNAQISMNASIITDAMIFQLANLRLSSLSLEDKCEIVFELKELTHRSLQITRSERVNRHLVAAIVNLANARESWVLKLLQLKQEMICIDALYIYYSNNYGNELEFRPLKKRLKLQKYRNKKIFELIV